MPRPAAPPEADTTCADPPPAPAPAVAVPPATSVDVAPPDEQPRRPLYPRLLGLRHLRLSGWQRALFGEGTLALAVLLVLADLASAWTLLVLPLAMALVVKAHDVLAGMLAAAPPARRRSSEESLPERRSR